VVRWAVRVRRSLDNDETPWGASSLEKMQKDPGDFHLSIESLEFERDIIKIIYDKYN
jgi:hypothetical protein